MKNEKYRQQIVTLSRKGLSIGQIAEKLDRNYSAIAKMCQKLSIHAKFRKVVKYCKNCTGLYYVKPSLRDRSKFCCRKCFSKWMSKNKRGSNSGSWKERVKLICKQCQKEFLVIPALAKKVFCCLSCRNTWYSQNLWGNKASNWQGGTNIVSNRRLGRASWKEKRRQILERDNYTCQSCGGKNLNLNVHHIDSWKTTKDDSFDNLVSLCKRCHQTIERNRRSLRIGILKVSEGALFAGVMRKWEKEADGNVTD